MNPLSPPVAIIEMLLLTAFAALVGWVLARLLRNGRLSELNAALTEQQNALEECRRQRTVPPVKANTFVTPEPIVAPVAEPIVAPIVAQAPIAPVVAAAVAEPETKVADQKTVILDRIASRANELNFDRIGRVAAAEADDLKDVVGIGPFYEKKLNSLGIYTFRQLGSCAAEDVQKITEITEFFPGRIERENWVRQSRELHEKKYGPAEW